MLCCGLFSGLFSSDLFVGPIDYEIVFILITSNKIWLILQTGARAPSALCSPLNLAFTSLLLPNALPTSKFFEEKARKECIYVTRIIQRLLLKRLI